MKKSFICLGFLIIVASGEAQMSVRYDPGKQATTGFQYFKPAGNLFVGDCIPFFHDNTYYLYWLLDSGHHSALRGLGGHQWALSTSKDLKNWKHYPVVLGIDEDWEKSICTGSVAYYKGKFYAFYATRLINAEGKVNEQLSYAVSPDGIHFKKQKPNPFYTYAPGYSKRDFRDPKVVIDSSGTFHLFVSSATDTALGRARGALVHLVSKDLEKWEVLKPLIANQDDVPECPDYFKWKNWYYLIYGRGGNTYYLKSKSPYGPWQYPASQSLNEDWFNVVKTAEFPNGRRIAAGWIPSKRGGKDDGGEIFGGNALLREVIQDANGDLMTKFPAELIPPAGTAIALQLISDSLTKQLEKNTYEIKAGFGMGTAFLSGIPSNCRITMDMEPTGRVEEYGLSLRAMDDDRSGYRLVFSPDNEEVWLQGTRIQAVEGLGRKIQVDIVMKDDIIDVSIDGKRCIVNRLGEREGTNLWLFSKHGDVKFSNVVISPLATDTIVK
jgi:beta-fructofuranosidase